MRLDELAKQQRQHHRRQKADQHIERELLRAALGGKLDDGGADALPVHQDDGKDRAGLDRYVEHLRLFAVEPEQCARKNQVAGRRDGKKFGQPLDHPHDDGLEQ
ncbi:hypothetical protein SDC9_90389 [bioreactor metagenome]|uniref:Uncharacterized protein n=1 Tax=bioreactor metagenome TaxID=1076179 RepID=A0A644ZS85_9ZZZZ